MGKSSFKDSLKALEADIQHANTLALDYPREKDGACLQMRLSYSPAAQFFPFLVQWTDCQLAGVLGLLRIFIYMTYADGKTIMSVYERKVSSVKEFYAVIFPSLLQLQRGITDLEDRKQKEVCTMRYHRKDEFEREKLSEIELEREEECGICMEMNSMVVLPNCSHSMCLKCYQDWHGRSQSCPFCRDCLKRVNSCDLWIYTERVILLIYHRFSERTVRGSSRTLINCLLLSPILYLFPMMFMLGESFSTGHDNCLYITSMAIYPYDAILKCKCFLGITL